MAELAIGTVSFLFQVFAGCVQGYELILDACRLEKDCQALLLKFKIEQCRLLDWAKLVQLDFRDDKLILNHLSKGIIFNILEQQQKLLFSFGRLNQKYGRLSKPLLEEMPHEFVLQPDRLLENGSTEGNNKGVQFPPTEELVEKSLRFMRSIQAVPRRLKWATFDHTKMEALITKLADFNNKMHDALDKAQMDLLLDMQTRTNDQIVLLNRTMSHMVEIYESSKQQLTYQGRSAILDVEDLEYDELSQYVGPITSGAASQSLAALAQQKFVHLAIEDAQSFSEDSARDIGLQHLDSDMHQKELNFTDVRTRDGKPLPEAEDIEEGQRTEAIYNKTSVWVEWKNPESTGPMQQDNGVDPKVEQRVKKLAALLSKNNRTVKFRAPFCRGYFIDREDGRFGLVFEKPATVPAETPPTSLHALISASNASNPQMEIPSLKDRIILMRLLSETVERLHAVDWLHKGLRSSNILLFAKNGEYNYADPYISGFDYSRPATSDDMTERPTNNPSADIYRHPSVQHRGNREDDTGRESYKKSFDLYSLGIVLLEIAYWKTIDQILDINFKHARPKHTWAVRDRLLVSEPAHLRFVKSYLGDALEDVIRSCLLGPEAFGLHKECDERREVVAAGLQKAFGERVVKRLGVMVVLMKEL
ncbi:hypothetical protein T440DRAFT_445469 [Plenodomus tracheiphilus IPT5]|uniref:Protein kinase domain-containing protein n=1 Tax=Plenodomus tracheiphilus IPT5 TaxID=1408161 RepID=A0A6A7BEJ0_9PLEO|nr:hypothetical protein T440DRAFT_445469 [Plenodomus tracheiphilus IPT5]